MATVLITGCNRGIGLELCRQFQRRGDTVIGVCRSASRDLAELGIRIIEGIDVADEASIETLRERLAGEHLDILLNNAGILRSDRFGALNYDDLLEQYRVNTLGPLRVTEALSDNLSAGSKVIIISSRVGSIADNSSGGNYGYRASKTAVNMMGVNLKHEFAPRGIAVGLLHPGMVATRMTGGNGVSPEEAARALIERIDELEPDRSGEFRHAEGHRLPW